MISSSHLSDTVPHTVPTAHEGVGVAVWPWPRRGCQKGVRHVGYPTRGAADRANRGDRR
jgi:hypothetical protein